MNIYIQKDTTTIYVELDFLLDENSYEIGTTWEDYKNGKWVLLSEEQVALGRKTQMPQQKKYLTWS